MAEEVNPQSSNNDAQAISKETPSSKLCMPDKIGGALCIFFTESPFSDFFSSSFIVDGKWYYSVEHFFQIQMLYSFGMFRLASKLIQIEDATSFRRSLRQNLKAMIKSELFDENMFVSWRKKNALRLVKKGCKAKFQQNLHLKQQLLATGERLMVFANKNDYLMGVGMSETGFIGYIKQNDLTLEKLLDYFTGIDPRPKQVGANYLGIALMEVRAEMLETKSVLADWKALQGIMNEDDGAEDASNVSESPVQDDSSTASNPETMTSSSNPTESSTSGSNTRELIVLPKEKRIVYKKKDAVEKVIGDPEDLKRRQLKAAEAAGTPPGYSTQARSTASQGNSFRSNSSVMQRLKKLQFEKPMVNPFSFGSPTPSTSEGVRVSRDSSDSFASHLSKQNTAFLPAKKTKPAPPKPPENEKTPMGQIYMCTPGFESEPTLSERFEEIRKMNIRKKKKKPPKGPAYHIEKGEIAPEGVIVPGGNFLPRITSEFAPETPPEAAFAKPAALPSNLLHLLPRPPTPPGCDSDSLLPEPTPRVPGPFWRPPGPPTGPRPFPNTFRPRGVSRNDWDNANFQPLGQPFPQPLPAPNDPRRLPVLKAPPTDLSEKKECWKMPENPLRDILRKAMILRKKIKNKSSPSTSEKGETFTDEGSNPLSRKKRPLQEDTSSENKTKAVDPIAFDTKLFPFGMEATLADLEEMGFVPPPINAVTGDPAVQKRNRHKKKYDYVAFFETAEAAFRHHANRWKKGGRLGITGEMEAYDSSDTDDEDVLLVNYPSSSEDEEETVDGVTRKKKKRRFETQVLFLDTSQYDEYVRFYQKTHGFVPLPSELDQTPNLDVDYLRRFHQYYRTSLNPWDHQASDMDPGAGPEELLSTLDFWQLSRWRWERELEGNVPRLEVEQKALKEGEITTASQAVSYVFSETSDNAQTEATLRAVFADQTPGILSPTTSLNPSATPEASSLTNRNDSEIQT